MSSCPCPACRNASPMDRSTSVPSECCTNQPVNYSTEWAIDLFVQWTDETSNYSTKEAIEYPLTSGPSMVDQSNNHSPMDRRTIKPMNQSKNPKPMSCRTIQSMDQSNIHQPMNHRFFSTNWPTFNLWASELFNEWTDQVTLNQWTVNLFVQCPN